jgi:hypothetical protein
VRCAPALFLSFQIPTGTLPPLLRSVGRTIGPAALDRSRPVVRADKMRHGSWGTGVRRHGKAGGSALPIRMMGAVRRPPRTPPCRFTIVRLPLFLASAAALQRRLRPPHNGRLAPAAAGAGGGALAWHWDAAESSDDRQRTAAKCCRHFFRSPDDPNSGNCRSLRCGGRQGGRGRSAAGALTGMPHGAGYGRGLCTNPRVSPLNRPARSRTRRGRARVPKHLSRRYNRRPTWAAG